MHSSTTSGWISFLFFSLSPLCCQRIQRKTKGKNLNQTLRSQEVGINSSSAQQQHTPVGNWIGRKIKYNLSELTRINKSSKWKDIALPMRVSCKRKFIKHWLFLPQWQQWKVFSASAAHCQEVEAQHLFDSGLGSTKNPLDKYRLEEKEGCAVVAVNHIQKVSGCDLDKSTRCTRKSE